MCKYNNGVKEYFPHASCWLALSWALGVEWYAGLARAWPSGSLQPREADALNPKTLHKHWWTETVRFYRCWRLGRMLQGGWNGSNNHAPASARGAGRETWWRSQLVPVGTGHSPAGLRGPTSQKGPWGFQAEERQDQIWVIQRPPPHTHPTPYPCRRSLSCNSDG